MLCLLFVAVYDKHVLTGFTYAAMLMLIMLFFILSPLLAICTALSLETARQDLQATCHLVILS